MSACWPSDPALSPPLHSPDSLPLVSLVNRNIQVEDCIPCKNTKENQGTSPRLANLCGVSTTSGSPSLPQRPLPLWSCPSQQAFHSAPIPRCCWILGSRKPTAPCPSNLRDASSFLLLSFPGYLSISCLTLDLFQHLCTQLPIETPSTTLTGRSQDFLNGP